MYSFDDLNPQLGEYIKQARKQRRITQEDLAEMVGLSPNHISKIECGGASIKVDTLFRIFHALGMSVDRFLALYIAGDELTPATGDYWQSLREEKDNSPRYRLKEAIIAIIDTFPYGIDKDAKNPPS